MEAMWWMLKPISFIACWHDEEVLHRCLYPSLPLRHPKDEVILIKGADSLSAGYAKGEEQAHNELLAFLHSDLKLSPDWRERVMASLDIIDQQEPTWGVLGLFGAKWHMDGEHLTGITTYGCVTDEAAWLERRAELPAKVDVLDSICLIKRKGAPLFDAALPTFQGAAEDLCMACQTSGRSLYVVDAFAQHFSSQASCPAYEQDLQTAAAYLVGKWDSHIPSTTKLWEYSLALVTGQSYSDVNHMLDSGLVPVTN